MGDCARQPGPANPTSASTVSEMEAATRFFSLTGPVSCKKFCTDWGRRAERDWLCRS